MGRRRIAHIGGDPSYEATVDRARGLTGGLEEAGAALVAEPLCGEWSEA